VQTRALHLTFVVAAVALSSAAGTAAGAAYDDANVSVYSTDAERNSTAEVAAAIENQPAIPPEVVEVGDQLVVAIDSAAPAADIDDRDGKPTERFFAVLDGEPELLVYQVNRKLLAEPWVFRLGPANTTAYRAGNATYVVIDTGSVTVNRSDPGGAPEAPGAGQKYVVDIADNVSDAEADVDEFTVVTSNAEFDREAHYDPLPSAQVQRPVDVYVRPDDRVRVTLSPPDGRSRSAPVELSDRYGYVFRSSITFGLGDVEPGTAYTMKLFHDGEVVDERNGAITEPESTVTNVRFVEVDGERHLNVTARLSHGGRLVTETADGERRAVVGGFEPDVERQVSIPVQADYRQDEDAAERFVTERGHLRAVRAGSPNGMVYPNATYAIDEVRQDTLTPAGSPTPTPSSTPTPVGTTPPPDATDDQPGFGPGVALVAPAVLAVLVGRRGRTG